MKPGFLDPGGPREEGQDLPPGQERPRQERRWGNPCLTILRRNARTPHSMRFAVRMSLQVELGLRALNRCATRLDEPLEGRLDAILHDARLAHRSFGAALIQFQRLDNWALPTELEVQERAPAT